MILSMNSIDKIFLHDRYFIINCNTLFLQHSRNAKNVNTFE